MPKKLNVKKKSGTRRSWLPEDLALLKKMAGNEPLVKIAAALKRTPGATRNRATMDSISLSTRPKKNGKTKKSC
jgi:hypothetical protein